MPMQMEATSSRRDIWLALALTACLFAVVHGHGLGDPWMANDDARQQLFWMQQWQEPGLYPEAGAGALLLHYAKDYVPLGVRELYRLASFALPPLEFSKVLTGLEFVTLGGLLFALGRGLAGRFAGWAVLCVYWLSPFFLHTISGGLARSFGAPLMALFWLSWQQGREEAKASSVCSRPYPARLGVTASLLLLGLFLPYIWAVCALALALGWLLGRLKVSTPPPAPGKWWDYPVLAVSAVPVLLFNMVLANGGFGPMVTEAEMQGDPVFGPLGRFPILPVPSLFFELVSRPWERLLPFREFGPVAGALVGLALFWLLWRGLRRCDVKALARRSWPFFCIVAASLALYFLARLMLLALFIPSRYLEYTTNLGYCVLLGVLLAAALRPWLRRPLLQGALVLLCLVLAGWRLHGEALHDYGEQAPLYEAVRETGLDALFAGHPYTMDNVLTFGRREVLASYELAHPWSKGLWERMRPRLEDMLGAYYARDAATVRAFAEKWRVDYMVVDTRHFSRMFMLPGRQFVPVCQAPMPDAAHSLCRALGLRFPVLVQPGGRHGFPGDHPLFAPYGEEIARLARRAGTYALLDREAFPGHEVQDGVWLVDVHDPRKKTENTK